MDIQALPYDILCQVLNKAGAHKPGDEADFTCVLPLLAVCRLWRELLPRAVYRSVSAVSRPGDGSIGGSITLARTSDLAHHVRRLHVTINSSADPLVFMDNMLAMMAAVRPAWSNVNHLHLEITATDFEQDDGAEVDAAIANRVSTTLGLVRSVLPGITKVDVRECHNGADELIGVGICDMYAAQLVHISAYEYLRLSSPAFSPEMTHLELSLAVDGAVWLPRTCAASLRFLFLDRTPNDYSWLPFKDSPNTQDLVFERLETLIVYFDVGPVADNHNVTKLRVPRLRRLFMYSVPDSCPLLDNIVLPKKMCPVQRIGDNRLLRHVDCRI